MGEMESHPILLCDNKEENNKRPVYSWIMNNTWETNFKMDLSGFSEFRYGVRLWSRKPQRKIWKACRIMTRVWLLLFADN